MTARSGSRDPRRHRFAAVVAAFVAAGRAEVPSERTIEFYLEGLNAYRAFARADDHDLTLADLDLDVGRAWLADFVDRRRKPATVAARAQALRVFSHWLVTDDYATDERHRATDHDIAAQRASGGVRGSPAPGPQYPCGGPTGAIHLRLGDGPRPA